MKLIHDTTQSCLAHLAKAIAGRDSAEKRKIIADFVGANEDTVRVWFKDHRLPAGERLIRLRFYLEFLGYKVDEIEILQDPAREAARLYAFGIASLVEISEMVGYSGEGRHAADSLLRVFSGERRASPEKVLQLSSFVDLYGARLDEKKRITPRALHALVDESHPSHIVERPAAIVAIRPTPRDVVGNQSAVVESFAGMITAMLPLAEYVLSDSFTAAQRSRVRELAADGRDVSRLSNLLTQLSGEAVRTALAKQQ